MECLARWLKSRKNKEEILNLNKPKNSLCETFSSKYFLLPVLTIFMLKLTAIFQLLAWSVFACRELY